MEKTLHDENIQIALISETWFKPGKYVAFKGYNIIRQDRDDGRSGVAIFVKNNIHYTEIINFHKINNFLCCAIRVSYENKPLNIISFYNNPENRTTTHDWSSFFESFQGNSIFGGDTNCHNTAWGCSISDPKGWLLLEALDKVNLVLLNDGQPTLLNNVSQFNSNVIDLCLATPEVAHFFNCKVLDDTFGSNHFPIVWESLSLSFESVLKRPIRKWNLKKANWDIFQKEMDSYTHSVINTEDFLSYESFFRNLEIACQKSIPEINFFNQNQRFRQPWWNKTCEEAIFLRKENLALYKRNPSRENFINYQKSDRHVKKTCAKENSKSWILFISSLNRQTKISQIWSTFKRFKNRKTSNTTLMKKGAWTEEFLNNLCPPLRRRKTANSQ